MEFNRTKNSKKKGEIPIRSFSTRHKFETYSLRIKNRISLEKTYLPEKPTLNMMYSNFTGKFYI